MSTQMVEGKKIVKPRKVISVQNRYRNQKTYYSLGVFSLMLLLMFTVDRNRHPLAIDPKLEESTFHKKTEYTSNFPLTSLSSGSSPTPLLVSNLMDQEFNKTKSLSLPDRINYWSQYLEKNQEGRKKLTQLALGYETQDALPIIPKKYNSRTFVETVVCLAKSENSDELMNQLLSQRNRKNKSDFSDQDHLNEADWISPNQNSKTIADITQAIVEQSPLKKLSGEKTRSNQQSSTSSTESKMSNRRIASIEKPNRLGPLPYIEISNLEKVLPFIPSGTMINLVHKNDENQTIMMSHLGFVIREGHQVLLRYSSVKGFIRTSELLISLKSLMRSQQSQRKWPLIGVNFNQVMSDSASESKRFKDSI